MALFTGFQTALVTARALLDGRNATTHEQPRSRMVRIWLDGPADQGVTVDGLELLPMPSAGLGWFEGPCLQGLPLLRADECVALVG